MRANWRSLLQDYVPREFRAVFYDKFVALRDFIFRAEKRLFRKFAVIFLFYGYKLVFTEKLLGLLGRSVAYVSFADIYVADFKLRIRALYASFRLKFSSNVCVCSAVSVDN